MVSPVRPEVGKEIFLSNSKGIQGKLREKPEDFRVEEIISQNEKSHWIWAKENKQGKHSIVRITAKNWDTHVLVKKLSKELGIGQKAIGFAGTKDKRALTTQFFSIKSEPERIKLIKLKNVDIDFKHLSIKPVRLGNLIGNKFTIKVSDVNVNYGRIKNILEDIRDGFPNYFGIQRFGAIRPITHLVGKKITMGDYEGAVWSYLTDGDRESSEYKIRSQLKKTRDFTGALKDYPSNMLFEKQIIGHLTRKKDDFIGALKQLPENLSKMFVHAYQSWIFNRTLHMRINAGYDIRYPLVGDNVVPVDNYGGPDQRKVIEVTEFNQKKLSKRCEEGKAWVVGLLPGLKSEFTKGIQGDIERKIMDEEGLKFDTFRIEEMPELTSLGMYRPLSQKPNDLEWNVDEHGCPMFNFWLHKGTYATSFLREIMKSEDMRVY